MEENDRYVTYREHAATKDELKAELHDLRVQQTRLMHVPTQIDGLHNKIDRLMEQHRAPTTGTEMTLFNVVEAAKNAGLIQQRPSNGNSLLLVLLGALGAAVLYLAWKSL